MLSYIAAVATAATLLISPILSQAAEGTVTDKKVTVVCNKEVVLNKQIVITSPNSAYVLSKTEQSILRMALLKSVKVLTPIHKS